MFISFTGYCTCRHVMREIGNNEVGRVGGPVDKLQAAEEAVNQAAKSK